MKKLFLFTIVLVISLPACSQSQTYKVDTTALLRDLQVLSADSMEGRLTGTAGSEKARRYIVNRFEEIGLTAYSPGYFQSFPLRKTHRAGRHGDHMPDSATGVNILGLIPGELDSVIVISAHYDHVGVRDGEIYNGADDNASGVAAMLAIAEYFMQNKPRHTLIFAAFDGEEHGIQGSAYFTSSLEVDLKSIVLNVNLDMVSQSSKNEIFASGTRYTPYLKELLTITGNESPVNLLFGHDGRDGRQDWTYSSDHGPFHKAGVPYVYFGVEDHPYYHKPGDTFENVPQHFFTDVTNLIVESVKLLDRELSTGVL